MELFIHFYVEPTHAFFADEKKKKVRTDAVSYTNLRAHETRHELVCRLLLEKQKKALGYSAMAASSQNLMKIVGSE